MKLKQKNKTRQMLLEKILELKCEIGCLEYDNKICEELIRSLYEENNILSSRVSELETILKGK